MKPIRTLIADDHPATCEGIAALLDADPEIEIVGLVADGLAAIEATAALEAQVVVMDIKMPGLDGIQAAHRIKAERPQTGIVILSNYAESSYLHELLSDGQLGYAYLLKTASIDEIKQTIVTVVQGGLFIDSQVGGQSNTSAKLERLTSREQEVLATVQLERCKRALGDPDQATQLIEETRAKIREAAAELRSRLADISPDIIANRGLVSALESLVDAARTRPEASGAAIKLHVDGYANKMLPEQQELAVFRCLQEALHNALRHAQASRVEVRLEIAGGWVIATVRDDGVGIERARINDALREGRLGLRNMWDRVEALEGEFRLRSHPGEGTTVWAAIPLPEESAADAISGG